MNLSRHAITAGIAALSLAACASPAFAQGGTGSGGGGTSGGGGGGGGRPPTCTSTLIDPVMQVYVVTCTQTRVWRPGPPRAAGTRVCRSRRSGASTRGERGD